MFLFSSLKFKIPKRKKYWRNYALQRWSPSSKKGSLGPRTKKIKHFKILKWIIKIILLYLEFEYDFIIKMMENSFKDFK